jgi:MftR C-terminal domain
LLDAQTQGIEELAEWVAESRGARVDELSLRVAGSALLAAVSVALDAWQRDGGKTDLLAVFDQATDALAAFARELSVRPADPSARE